MNNIKLAYSEVDIILKNVNKENNVGLLKKLIAKSNVAISEVMSQADIMKARNDRKNQNDKDKNQYQR